MFLLSADFLREDTLVGTSFLRVAAHDDDFGSNAAILYSMSQEQPEYLQVNPVTGWVYVNQPISQVSQRLITGSPSRTQTPARSQRLYQTLACGSVSTELMNEPHQSASVCRLPIWGKSAPRGAACGKYQTRGKERKANSSYRNDVNHNVFQTESLVIISDVC